MKVGVLLSPRPHSSGERSRGLLTPEQLAAQASQSARVRQPSTSKPTQKKDREQANRRIAEGVKKRPSKPSTTQDSLSNETVKATGLAPYQPRLTTSSAQHHVQPAPQHSTGDSRRSGNAKKALSKPTRSTGTSKHRKKPQKKDSHNATGPTQQPHAHPRPQLKKPTPRPLKKPTNDVAETKRSAVSEGEKKQSAAQQTTSKDARTSSNHSIVAPVTQAQVNKKRANVFKAVTTTWFVLVVIAASVVSAWGYTVWQSNASNKHASAAYAQGMRDATAPPDVSSVLKVTPDKLTPLLVNAPGAQFPPNVALTNFRLVGWSIPGGVERRGTAELAFCYTGDGVPSPLSASAFVVTDNATALAPQWNIDSVAVTGDRCEQ